MIEIIAVSRKALHGIAKPNAETIRLVAAHGVEGDVHFGVTVQHRSRVMQNPDQPNLRQVHLIHAELFDELAVRGFRVAPGDMGENITTRGVNLLALPEGTELVIGNKARLQITGLRNPCKQLNGHAPGLMNAVLGKDADGNLIRKAGVMALVLEGGEVRAGDAIMVHLPEGEQRALAPV
ncbi:MOSC domain-containing protein [Parasphingopyxis algicola]|uniref:MOSC domain-containing protein n=1 Tax=Parasphingopyxis algicola TaxID=2026624 RepID=UPI0015A15CA8|nr:MOSC domain-containing protein [Parasphingopyxis algicola]QLC23846.1 MOSC domain-containing protein [Parasphingopyxis algicola]